MADTDPWKTRCDDEEADDLFFAEEGATFVQLLCNYFATSVQQERKLKKKEAQDDMKKAGMLLVSGQEWRDKLQETLIEAYIDKDKVPCVSYSEIFKKVERVGKATCLVWRKTNSKNRKGKTKKDVGGTGTGFLMSPKSKYGWLVITNNHVILDEVEANSAEVFFDHLNDDSRENATSFKVEQLVSKDIRTKSAEDLSSLDFSVLALKSDDTNENYLENHASSSNFDESERVNAAGNKSFLNLLNLKFLPIIAFSHPKGLGKRLSIGKYPDKCETYPISHIKHDLPTQPGSSGANLIYPCQGKFDDWWAAFLHYRHHRAVAWQAIGPVIRKDFSLL